MTIEPAGHPIPATIDAEQFRTLLSRFASGVTVVTLHDGTGRPHGMTVSAFCSVSLVPPLVLVCIDRGASMAPGLASSPVFGVNVLASDQAWISRRFADEAMEMRFDGVDWTAGPGGVPWIAGAHASLACVPDAAHAAGDHVVLIGRVVAGSTGADSSPLVYHRGTYGRLVP